jgi:hypothetical protein
MMASVKETFDDSGGKLTLQQFVRLMLPLLPDKPVGTCGSRCACAPVSACGSVPLCEWGGDQAVNRGVAADRTGSLESVLRFAAPRLVHGDGTLPTPKPLFPHTLSPTLHMLLSSIVILL